MLFKVTQLDLATALVSAMPAGLSDIAVVSSDLGANSTQTTVVHTIRTLFAIIILPQAAFRLCEYFSHDKEELERQRAMARKLETKPPELRTTKNMLITLCLAEVFGIVGKFSGIPSGALTFAVFAVAGQNITRGTAYLPRYLKLGAQCLTGILVGINVTIEDVLNMGTLIKPVILVLICTTICNYFCAFLLHKVCRLDLFYQLVWFHSRRRIGYGAHRYRFGRRRPRVGVLQLVRYIGLFSVMPFVIKFLVSLS